MANKKKALRASPFDDAEIEASIFGGSAAEPVRKESHKSRMPAKSDSKGSSQQDAKEPMEKIMMRLPRSLAVEFQQVYLQLAAWHLKTYDKKLHVQDCHFEMMRDWVEKQKRKLAT